VVTSIGAEAANTRSHALQPLAQQVDGLDLGEEPGVRRAKIGGQARDRRLQAVAEPGQISEFDRRQTQRLGQRPQGWSPAKARR